MKTPEQIAKEVLVAQRSNLSLEELMVAVIEADRKQRPSAHSVIDLLLSSWEDYDGDVSGFQHAWAEHLDNGTPVPLWAII